MKKLLFLIAIAMLNLSAMAQTKPEVIDLWPNGMPNDNGLTGDEYLNENGRITNVTRPTLTVYPAPNPNGMAIVACPGGGYVHLAMEHEGTDMAAWYNAQGITYAVLKYRMPNGNFECPLSDVRQAMHVMHKHADKWRIDHKKIGVQGASAGGHLASSLATHYDKLEQRPAFQILFYPVIYLNEGPRGSMIGKNVPKTVLDLYSNDKQVTVGTSPAFIMCSTDDQLCVDHCIRYYQALHKHNIPSSLHIYPEGGHGWGFKDSFRYKRQWTGELEKWLREIDLNLTKKGSQAVVLQQKKIEEGGTGPYKAIAAKVSTFEDYVIFRPADLAAAAKAERKALPLMIFGNGACSDNSVHYENMLSEIASHGYVVIALGELRMSSNREGSYTTRSSQMTYAIDWMEQQVADIGSEYHGVVDISRLATAGHSCGGAQVLATAADPRVKAHILYNSGIGELSMAGADSKSLSQLHAPILYMPGGSQDVATPNAEIDYNRINNVPVVLADHLTAGHGGTFDQPQGGLYGRLSLAWLDWLFKGKKENAKVFEKGNNKDYSEFTIKSKNF